MRYITTVLLFSLFLSIIPDSTECREIRKDYHETFDLSRGSGLRLKHGDGNVIIKRWEKDVLEIDIEYIAEYKSIGPGDKDFKVTFKEKNKIIEITGNEKSSPSIGFHFYNVKEYTYTIHAPDYLLLDLCGDDGEVYIDDWRANIELDIDDGDVVLSGVECDNTSIRMEDGELTIGDHKGNLDIDCDDGSIEIFRSNIQEGIIRGEDGLLSIRDTKGDFDIELDDGEGAKDFCLSKLSVPVVF